MPELRRRNRLASLVEETMQEELPTVEETVEEQTEAPFAVDAEKLKGSPLKDIVDEVESTVLLTETELMDIDTEILLTICKQMGYTIPAEGKNTNKKVRKVIVDNGGIVTRDLISKASSKSVEAEATSPIVRKTITSTGKVYIEKSVTKNMGDYNSAKVTVGIELPIDFVDSELAKANEAISVALELVDSRLELEVDKLI